MGRPACKSILIVEDDEGIRDALSMTLEMEGYSVLTATNGKEGLDLLPKVQTPCLILLDLMMPVMDGWAFVENVDSDMILATIPIVVVTAFSEKSKAPKKVSEVIKKPVDIDQLLALVKRYCG